MSCVGRVVGSVVEKFPGYTEEGTRFETELEAMPVTVACMSSLDVAGVFVDRKSLSVTVDPAATEVALKLGVVELEICSVNVDDNVGQTVSELFWPGTHGLVGTFVVFEVVVV